MRKILLFLFIFLNIQIKAQCWKTVAAGVNHTVALKTDNTLWAWGNNMNGQLGDGTTITKNKPIRIDTTNNWQIVVAGDFHTVAIKTDGTLWAWGDYGYRELDVSSPINRTIPTQIGSDTNWKTVAAGGYHTVAIKTDGTLWAWGNNEYGQLGDGTKINKTIPIQIGTANNWQTISTGQYHTIAIKTDGTLWAWGFNSAGQLGDGTFTDRYKPTQIGTTNNWKTISAGNYTTAIKTDGTLWGWGPNYYGQLGDGTNTNKNTPTQIGTANNWQTITAGNFHTAAIKTDGTLWTCGQNYYGQLGDSTTIDKNIFTQTDSETNWKNATAGNGFTLAIKTDNTLFAWGFNNTGKLGDGTTVNKNIPTLVDCLGTFTVTSSLTNLKCTGSNDGSASISSVSGGIIPYTYLWSNGATTNSITGLKAGNYSCTITDATSLSVTKSFSITVGVDTQNPTISYMPNITVNTNSNCTATNVLLGTPVTSDNCSVASVTNNAPSSFPLGNTKVTWTVKDASNNVATITQSVTVNDVTKPTITAPPTVIVNADSNGTATGITLGTPTTTDNCSVASVTNNAPTTFLSGNTTVTWTVKDGSNNIATATQIVTVIGGNPTTLIPNINFEKKLIALGIDSGTTDGKVLTSNISSLTSLDVSSASITNLTGIQDFVALTSLNCSNNQLTTLDVSKNVALSSLDCSYNYGLISFDPAKNIALTSLKSNGNSKLLTFDVSKNLALTDLECNNINLTTLDVSANTSLLSLRCYNNRLTTLDVTKNTALKVLNCYSNQLSAIDVSNNVALDTLNCNSNKLITLDISKNINLKRLNCSNNKLTSLNLKNGNNSKLEIPFSGFNYNPDLFCIQVDNKAYSDKNWSDLKDTTTNYSDNCPPQNILISSEFEDKLIALGIDKDGKNGSILSAEILNVKSIDISNSGITNLSGIEYFMNLESLICKGNLLSSIDFSKNTLLKYLDCSNNPLTALDVSKNILLVELYCDGGVAITNKTTTAKNTGTGRLTALDLSNNLLLTKLSCSNNQIVNLDLSKNTLLTDVNCSNNNLQNLNLNNSNNTKMLTVNFKSNSSLFCIKVDNTAYSNTNWAEAKDTTTRYSEDCEAPLTLPSDNFTIESKGESCLNQNNGEINITAKANYNYVASINGTKYPLVNNSLKVSNLTPAIYNVSITITGELFEQNFTVTIPKGATITAKSTVSPRLASVEITEGTAPYTIFVNGEEQFETASDTFSVGVNKGDFLEVKTAKACEGIYLKEIDTDVLESVLAHPNPTNGKFEIEIPISIKEIVIDLYTMDSKIISKETYTPTNGRVPLNLENQASGIYIAKIYLAQPKYLKIIKK